MTALDIYAAGLVAVFILLVVIVPWAVRTASSWAIGEEWRPWRGGR